MKEETKVPWADTTFPQSHLIGGESGIRVHQFLTHCTALISKRQTKEIQVLFGLAGDRNTKELKVEIKYLYWTLQTGNGIFFLNITSRFYCLHNVTKYEA